MRRLIALLFVCLLMPACREAVAQTSDPKIGAEFFVGTASDEQAWPYRYTLVRTSKGWHGEVELHTNGSSFYFATLKVISSTDGKITFEAPLGAPGKALPMSWELTLTKSKNGFDGELISTNTSNREAPIKLHFAPSRDAVLPSSRAPDYLKALDDSNYRTDAAVLHEVSIAKREWERESAIAARIAVLRKDDVIRGGVRWEWMGPAWVRERLSPEQSRYFEKICCVYLGGSRVTDDDVLAICDLPELRELFLYRTSISDGALTRIDRLGALRVLHLGNTKISDPSLEKIGNLANLRSLYLNDTNVSDNERVRLRSQLRDTRIEW